MPNRCTKCGVGIVSDRTKQYQGHSYCHTCYEKYVTASNVLVGVGLFFAAAGVFFSVSLAKSSGGVPVLTFWQSFIRDELPVMQGMFRSGPLPAVRGFFALLAHLGCALLILLLQLSPLIGVLVALWAVRRKKALKRVANLRSQGYWPAQKVCRQKQTSELHAIAEACKKYFATARNWPSRPEELKSAGLLTDAFLEDYELLGGDNGILAISRAPLFPQRKGETVEEPSQAVEEDILSCRALLKIDKEPEFLPEPDFGSTLAQTYKTQEGSQQAN